MFCPNCGESLRRRKGYVEVTFDVGRRTFRVRSERVQCCFLLCESCDGEWAVLRDEHRRVPVHEPTRFVDGFTPVDVRRIMRRYDEDGDLAGELTVPCETDDLELSRRLIRSLVHS